MLGLGQTVMLLELSEAVVILQSLSEHFVVLMSMAEVSIVSLRCPDSLCLVEAGKVAAEVRVRAILNEEFRGSLPVLFLRGLYELSLWWGRLRFQ